MNPSITETYNVLDGPIFTFTGVRFAGLTV
ncbi:Uncharacterised protein [Mycobacteroides abscessus subsp. abscessus]|nr:Uncharacterised protein [Mycobacteroides abscessus subsp. abscessus]